MSYIHGGDIYGDNTIKLDFSVNTNCLGMPREVKSAVIDSADAWEQYPDAFCRDLRKAAADFYSYDGTPFPEEWLVFGNGASDVLYTIISALRPKKAFLLAPGFSEYEKALNMYGCQTSRIYLKESDGFSAENIIENLDLIHYTENWNKIFILGNPNNPTGKYVPVESMEKIARFCKKTHTWLLIDECFQWFLQDRQGSSFVRKISNDFSHVIILNALTKICSVAGLRLGYGIIPDDKLRMRLDDYRQPWSVSVPAQVGGVAAFNKLSEQSNEDFIKKTLNHINTERQWLMEKLKSLGFKVYPSETNYILFRTSSDDTSDYKELCLKHGILIRSCGNFIGLNNHYYRVAVKIHSDNEILIDTLRHIKNVQQ